MPHSRKMPQACAATFWHSPLVFRLDPYKGLYRISFRPIRLRPSPSNRNCKAISLFASSLTSASPNNRSEHREPPIRTVLFGSLKPCGSGVFLCLEMDQSGTGAGTSLSRSQLPRLWGSGAHFLVFFFLCCSNSAAAPGWRLCFHWTPGWGLLLALNWWQRPFVNTAMLAYL